MPKKIACGSNAETFQRLGAPLSDSFEEFDRSVQPDGRGRGRGHPLLGGLDCCFRQEVLGKPLGVERLQILHRFAQPDKPYR
jgi:hypothetical protein